MEALESVRPLAAVNEMGASLRPLVHTVHYMETEPLRAGSTYWRGLLAVLPNFSLDWQGGSYVLAARTTLSVGLDVLDATSNPGKAPDGEFVAWLTQVQGVWRLPEFLLGTQIYARVDSQLTNRALLSIEKFAVGGERTVRGYRTNQLVRDQGVVASIEARIPVYRSPLGRPILEFTPFADVGVEEAS